MGLIWSTITSVRSPQLGYTPWSADDVHNQGSTSLEALHLSVLGAICSVGFDVATTCASIRAGISRPATIPGLTDVDPESNEPEPVVGHPAGSAGDGFTGTARWVQLLIPCVRDMCRAGELPPWEDQRFWGHTAVFIVTPYLDDGRYHPNPHCTPEGVRSALVLPLNNMLQGRFQPRSIRVVPRGRIGIFELVSQFYRIQRTDGFERALVIAVDSWLDGSSLNYLMTMGRLKTASNPVGLMPGEGAFAILLEPQRAAQHRGAAPGPVIRRCSLGVEPLCLMAAERSQGFGLAARISAVLHETRPQQSYPTHIADLNGETWRATEWGSAAVRLLDQGIDVSDRELWLPATSVGDVGAGSSILGMQIAARAFARNYSQGPSILVTASDEHGDVGALLVEKD